jgi:hypothetical protein
LCIIDLDYVPITPPRNEKEILMEGIQIKTKLGRDDENEYFEQTKSDGPTDLQVLRRYLAQTSEYIAQAHRIGSPVDNNML